MIDEYEKKYYHKNLEVLMIDKLSGDQKIRIDYLEKQIRNHNQKHKDLPDLQIILKAELGLLDGISDQFSLLGTS